MSVEATFARTVDALDDIFRFTAETFAREGVEPSLRAAVDFVLEELFTNIVKYGRPGGGPVKVELTRLPGGVEVAIVEEGADRFDVTAAAQVDTTLPLEKRTPGGLGLHLIGKLVDSLEYRYDLERRQGRVVFRKMLAAETEQGMT